MENIEAILVLIRCGMFIRAYSTRDGKQADRDVLIIRCNA